MVFGHFLKTKEDESWKLKFSSDLLSYKSFCKQEPSLKDFDVSLHTRTTRVINSLVGRAASETSPLCYVTEVYGFLLEVNEEAVRVITGSKEDVLGNKDLRSLADLYFNSTAQTLEFCNSVENCVKRAQILQLTIRLAVKLFEKESTEAKIGGNKKKYAKTLDELNRFAGMGDPFNGEFVTQYEALYKQQVLLLDELRNLNKKLDWKKLKGSTWPICSSVVFATAFVSVLVLSVALAVMSGPPVAIAVAAALIPPVEYAAKWSRKVWKAWKAYKKTIETQKKLVETIDKHATCNKEATKTIRILVDSLRIRISSMMQIVEFAVEREDEEVATKIAMEKIQKKVDDFAEKIEDVGQKVTKFSHVIAEGRVQVLGHILGLSAK